jgi:hypothetical protein
MSCRSLKIKQRVLDNQNGLCYWCGKPLILTGHSYGHSPLPDNYATTDHIFTKEDPIRKLYRKNHTPSPFVVVCPDCNQKRGDLPIEQMENLCGKPHKNWHKDFTAGTGEL